MQKEQSALLVHRENYEVPKGQEQVVHYKIAKLGKGGAVIEPARIVRDEPKLFESVLKRNLETMGYTVEILHHPLGKYSSVRIETADEKLQAKDAEIAQLKAQIASNGESDKDAEIARLKAELAKAKAAKPAKASKAPKKEPVKKEA